MSDKWTNFVRGAELIYGPATVFIAEKDAENLGTPCEDERWELLHPSVPDFVDPNEQEEG